MSISSKKISFILISMVLAFQLGVSPFQLKSVYALDDVEIFGERVNFYVEETPIKRVVTSWRVVRNIHANILSSLAKHI